MLSVEGDTEQTVVGSDSHSAGEDGSVTSDMLGGFLECGDRFTEAHVCL